MKKYFLILFFAANFSYAAEIKNISATSYIEENSSIERKAIIDSLIHQFDNRRIKGITQEDLDRFYAKKGFPGVADPYSSYIMRFQIINQRLYASKLNENWFPEIVLFLQALLTHYKVNDVDFILWHNEKIRDVYKDNLDNVFFLFSKSNSVYDQDKFLFPDFFMMKDWQKLIDEIELSNKNNPWNKKENKIFWRGMPTASLSDLPQNKPAYYGISIFDKLPRLTLVMLAKLYPDLIDARFTEGTRIDTELQDVQDLQDVFDKLKLVDNARVAEADHLKYKYLISIDGNTCAWKRVPWIMLSNSTLVKQETDRAEWFYPALKPYYNYVPVNEKISDIFSQLEWMKKNDQKVKEISENARSFIRNELMPGNIEAHAAIILNEYSKLHKGAKIIATLPPAEEALQSFYVNKEASAKAELQHKKDVEALLLAQEKENLVQEKEKNKSKMVEFCNKIWHKFKKFLAKI